MQTFLWLAAAMAVVLAISLAMQAMPRLRRATARAGRLVMAPLILASRGVSRAVDFFLTPSGVYGRVRAWRYAVWLIVGLVPLGLFVASIAWPIGLPAVADPGYLLLLGAFVQALVLVAGFLIVYEDIDVMDGVVAPETRRMRGRRIAARLPVVALALLLFVTYAGAVAYWLAEARGFPLLVQHPQTGWPVVDYALVALWVLPTRLMVALADWATGEHMAVIIGTTPQAQGYAVAFGVIGAILVLGVATALIQRRWQLRRFLREIAAVRDENYLALVHRARRAPTVIKRGIIVAAIFEPDAKRQLRLFDLARDAMLPEFPLAVCTWLRTLDEAMQPCALDRTNEVFRHNVQRYDSDAVKGLFALAMRVLRRGRLASEPTRRLLRVMLTIANARPKDIGLGERDKQRIRAIVAAEFKKPRAAEDAALRGYLRELLAVTGVEAQTAVQFVPATMAPRRPRQESRKFADGSAAKAYGAANGKDRAIGNGHARPNGNGAARKHANGGETGVPNGAGMNGGEPPLPSDVSNVIPMPLALPSPSPAAEEVPEAAGGASTVH